MTKYSDIAAKWGPLLWIILVVVAVYLTAPKGGHFEWSEAPRNALNGAFFFDLLRERPFADPVAWAYDYYLQYPALTILFYPPVFHLLLGLSFTLLGVSHEVAVATVCGCLALLLWATYRIGLFYAGRTGAFYSALLMSLTPSVLLWSQQVMLEIPMLAFATWSVYFIIVYCDRRRSTDLLLAICFGLTALYTKQTAALILLPMAIYALIATQAAPFRRRSDLLLSLVGLVLLIPLAVMQLKFGEFNITTVIDRSDVDIGRFSATGLLWYAAQFDRIMGLPVLASIFLGLAFTTVSGSFKDVRRAVLVLALWLGAAYLALTLIDLKEIRHALVLTPAAAILGGVLIASYEKIPRAAQVITVIGVVTFPLTLFAERAPWVSGYAQMSEAVAGTADDGDRIVFLGNRDGSFIFNIRSRAPEMDLTVVRADKLLLDINIMPDHGLNPRQLDRASIQQLLWRLGIRYAVTVPEIWMDAPSIQAFYEILQSDEWELLRTVPVEGNASEGELLLYRFRGPVKAPPDSITYETSAGDMVVH